MKVEFNFSEGTSLTYQLNDTKTAARWAEKLSKHEVGDLNAIKECRDMFLVHSTSWKLLNEKWEAELAKAKWGD